MRKRLSGLILTAMMVLAFLSGCGDAGESHSSFTDRASGEGSYADRKVGICIYLESDKFMAMFRNELVNYLVLKGFSRDNILIYSSENDQDVQMEQFKELVTSHVDALIVNPVNSNVVRLMTDMAIANKIPCVYINREPSADEEDKWEEYELDVSYVGCDARQSGILQGKIILDIGEKKLDVNGNGRIEYYMLEGDPENSDSTYRTAYSVSTLENAGMKLECLFQDVADWDRTTARLATYKEMIGADKPELIICNNDAMALGAKDAALEVGLKPGVDVFIVGVDGLPEALESVMDGSLSGTVFNDFISQSHSAADAAINYIDGLSNEHYIGCDYIKISSENAEKYLKLVNEKEN